MKGRAGVIVAVAALALTACSPVVRVRTVISPDANLSSLRTFRVLPTPESRRKLTQAASDPMLVNSISNRALRNYLTEAFQSRGYVVDDNNPDFTVAYYASARQKLEVDYWDYGYRWRPRWWGARAMVTEYTEGTVIVDVIDSRTKELLFRGHGVAVVSDDEEKYLRQLKKTVSAIVKKFPPAQS